MIEILLALNLLDVKNAKCDVACKYMGYDSGYYQTENCLCYDTKEFEWSTTRKKTPIPRKRKKEESTVLPSREHKLFDFLTVV